MRGVREQPGSGTLWGIRPTWFRARVETRGGTLVEFAIALPLLVVLALGFADFGAAFRLKQKLTNAAREGARIGIGQPSIDLTQTVPLSVQAVRAAVINYMISEDLDTSFIASTPTSTGTFEWTYSSGGGDPVLVIERGVVIPVGGTMSIGTRVTLNYPFSWSFDRVVRLLSPTTTQPGSFTISTSVTMKNLA